jgi:hypothetical protein
LAFGHHHEKPGAIGMRRFEADGIALFHSPAMRVVPGDHFSAWTPFAGVSLTRWQRPNTSPRPPRWAVEGTLSDGMAFRAGRNSETMLWWEF